MPDTVVIEVPANVTYSINELDAVAGKLLKEAGNCRVWLFRGELGAGKTTLIKAICARLGVDSGMSSPGFSIVNEYNANGEPVYHCDFYRLRKEEEAFDIGVEEYLDSGHYCFVEWPERIPSLIPAKHMSVAITITGAANRVLEYQLHE